MIGNENSTSRRLFFCCSMRIRSVVFGIISGNFFLSRSARTPPRTVRCVRMQAFFDMLCCVFPCFRLESQYQVQIAVRYFHNLSITRMMMMMSIEERGGEKNNMKKKSSMKFRSMYAIFSEKKYEEINFKIPIWPR